MIDVKIALRQARAARVAEFSFQQRLERIEWEETVLIPYLEELKEKIALEGTIPVFELEQFADECLAQDENFG